MYSKFDTSGRMIPKNHSNNRYCRRLPTTSANVISFKIFFNVKFLIIF
jgi:hypothetical protein